MTFDSPPPVMDCLWQGYTTSINSVTSWDQVFKRLSLWGHCSFKLPYCINNRGSFAKKIAKQAYYKYSYHKITCLKKLSIFIYFLIISSCKQCMYCNHMYSQTSPSTPPPQESPTCLPAQFHVLSFFLMINNPQIQSVLTVGMWTSSVLYLAQLAMAIESL